MTKPIKSKKVLMICYNLPPCGRVGGLRSYKFLQNLHRFNWVCEVITIPRRNMTGFEKNKDVCFHYIWDVDIEKILAIMTLVFHMMISKVKRCIFRFLRKPSVLVPSDGGNREPAQVTISLGLAGKLRRFFSLPDTQVIWMFLALPRTLFLLRKCDIIYSSYGPASAHVLALIAHKLSGKPWVADYRDEWTLNKRWSPATKFHAWLDRYLDKACVKNASCVINVSEARTALFVDNFKAVPTRFVTLHNGYDEEDIAQFRGIKPDAGRLVITSLGNLFGGRDARPFLRSIHGLCEKGYVDRDKIAIQFIGAGSLEIEKEIIRLNFSDVAKVIPRKPQEEAFADLSKSHIALLVGSDMEQVAMTTKVYEYVGMGKPILALVPPGQLKDFVSKYGGWCAGYDDENEIAEAIRDIWHKYKFENMEIQVDTSSIKQFERRNLTERLSELFDELI